MEAMRQMFDENDVRFFACDFWNGSDAQCDLFQNVSGIGFPVLLNADVLGEPDQYNCSYHYAFVIDGDGIVAYRGSVNIPAMTAVIEDAVERLNGAVGVDDVPGAEAILGSNYPNPFNPSTSIPYDVPVARDGAVVRLDVLDIRGRLVRTLVSSSQPAGQHLAVFDGRDDAGNSLPSGSYLARLRVDGQEQARLMTLIK
jgi:hypothetical protein